MIYIIYIQPIYYRKCTLERMRIPAYQTISTDF
uniref:Uncharacterized protein n=1 Tax=Anguilla anguilla TaxID=7936 RepID=A0A0E9REA7_ANGAN